MRLADTPEKLPRLARYFTFSTQWPGRRIRFSRRPTGIKFHPLVRDRSYVCSFFACTAQDCPDNLFLAAGKRQRGAHNCAAIVSRTLEILDALLLYLCFF